MEQGSATLGDATISHSDLEYLKPSGWLNDSIISVWCEHVMRREYGSNLSNCPVSILLPNVSYFLLCLQDESELRQISKSYDLENKQLVIAIINDSPLIDVTSDRKQASGDHWSIVVFDRRQLCFYHLDSLPHAPNGNVSERLVARLKAMLSLRHAGLVTLDVPLQRNLCDCGKFLPFFFMFFFLRISAND